ncbi:uncharacterized protein A4U43_C03F32060 [Asparagus officinalis]|uniref:Uncharacterized protein n=1 Tax=Asparagus officinalis TaxID=4686 RepID=A0A5P1FIQ1_ASPOF|nr:uncharacterized protein A4U43_C03F32060 [Asparagus officinalis]
MSSGSSPTRRRLHRLRADLRSLRAEIGKDGEIERLSMELAELQKSKRQLLALVEQKDAEIRERNATIQSYLDKIVNLTESNSSKEARVHETEAELGRCRAACSCLTQEKELLEKHNAWLNEELTAKVNSLVELRRTHMDVEAELSSKLSDHERHLSEASNSLKWSKERVHELELRVNSLEEELRTTKEAAASNEERFTAELSTVTKLVELYKTSSEEWSKKAAELEGVIKALETHLSQTENDYKEKLEKEASVRKDVEKEADVLREKLEKCEAEIENTRKASESSFLPLSSFHADFNAENLSIMGSDGAVTNEIGHMIVPRVPIGISGTALAASLLRDGWSLAKMYEKYQEANDAFLHEREERKNAERTLNKVFHEIEEKVGMILDERAEHERMVEAYTLMNQKLQDALLDHDNLENTIRQLKAELKTRQRDYTIAEKELEDLQKQITVLLKECQDVQLRCGGSTQMSSVDPHRESPADIFDATDAERIVSENLLTFKDINGLVEQNVQLRRLVHSFSIQEEKRNAEIREDFQLQLQKVTDEAAAKVEAVLKRSEEQACMIESLHSSVAMYKRLYEEERKIRVSSDISTSVVSEDGKKDFMVLFEGSQEVSKKSHEQLSERAKNLEQELATLRGELLSLRSERDKMSLEANFASARLDSFMKEFDHQRQEANAVSARNVELTHLIVDYQRRLRASSDSLQASEENSRKLSMEVSILKHEKEILMNSEKRASDEVRSLSERIYRLQSSLDAIQSVEEIHENTRSTESRKHEEHLKRVEMEWAEAKKELQEERDRVRSLTLEKEKAVENSVKHLEEMRKELADAWRAVASAESRAAVAEARCSELGAKISLTEMQKVTRKDGGDEHSALPANEVNGELWKTKDELEKLKQEARANKEYMLQYKEIARTNETALKQIESAHEEYKLEAQKLKKALEDEIQSLRIKVHDLESSYKLKSEESALAIESKEQALSLAMTETLSLRQEIQEKSSQIEMLEIQVSSLKEDVVKEQKRWRTAQDNYERQIILQSETIQELTSTSKELSTLQSEITKLKKLSEAQKTENDLLKKSWENEKVELQQLKSEAERKYYEVNEQNKLLHNRLEALHTKLVDKEHSSSGVSSRNTDSKTDNDLQNVISYLRRSKEIAETEISLLKQEKLRLQSQLEVALKASENAQTLLRSQHENTREQLFKDEDFKALQLQVREINLLRESNVQLRAENKHNFEESQKFREAAQMAKMEAENFVNLLRTKELELDACRKEIEMLKLENGHLNNRITELHESTKNVDLVEYERMKDEHQQIKVILRERELEVELTRTAILEKQDAISRLEQVIDKSQSDLAEQDKKFKDSLQAEVNTKQENEKQKKAISVLKKKNETLTREKEELHFKNQALLKQLEDSKSSRKIIGESSSEQAKKDQEKDTRIQILEKTLERQKEDLKKERDDNKLKQKKSRITVMDLLQKVKVDKTKMEEELAKHKHAIALILERSGMTASQLPPDSNLDEQTLAYFQSTGKFEDFVNSVMNEGDDGPQPSSTESPSVDMTAPSGQQVGSHLVRPSAPQAKATEPTVPRPSIEGRKTGGMRRIIRPRIDPRPERPVEPSVDAETSVTEPPTVMEEGRPSVSQEVELPSDSSLQQAPSVRKRSASSSLLELREDSVAQDEACADVVPSLKKSKHVEAVEGSSDVSSVRPSAETHDIVQQPTAQPADISESQPVPASDAETEQAPTLANDEIIDEVKNEDDILDIKEEIDEQQKDPLVGTNQEDEVPYEGDAVMDELSDRPNITTELTDEPQKGEEVKDQSAVESEDEREEGEMMPDDAELQEDTVSGDTVVGDGAEIGDEGGDATEVASPEAVAERNDEVDATEDDTESSDKHNVNNNDQGAPDSSQSPQKPTVLNSSDQSAPQSPQRSVAVREGSPASVPQSSVSERRSPSPNRSVVPTETDEHAQTRSGGRTISITERARENARLRQQQARMNTPTPPRGRGRTAGSNRARGTRGRGGRGPA